MGLRIHAFHCGGDRASRAVYDPLDPGFAEVVYGPYFFYLIEHPRGPVVFDTGLHPKWVGSGAGDDAGLTIVMEEGQDARSKLATIGVDPAAVEHVVMSHLHLDHAGGLQFFPNANIYAQQSEIRFAYWPSCYQRELYDRDDFDHGLRWVEQTGERDIYGDGTIVAIPTPGHTPGHQSLLVRLDSGVVVLAADAHYRESKMRERKVPGIVWSPDAMVESWYLLEEIERREGAKLLFTHDLDGLETKRIAPDAYYE
jgi:N-acyl homoserine lactone hydrolase